MSSKFALRATRGGHKSDIENLRALDYDGQTTNFTVGDLITGGTSGATGTLVSQTDAGATGTLILSNVVGDFVDNDALTDAHTGDGSAVGGDYCPLLAPSDQIILQIDATSMTKAEALELVEQLEMRIIDGDWPKS